MEVRAFSYSKTQLDRVMSYIRSGAREGGRLVLGGTPLHEEAPGFFILPTVFADVTDNMIIFREKIFGPVVVISTFETEEQAIKKANNSVYGLSARYSYRTLNEPIDWPGKWKAGWDGSIAVMIVTRGLRSGESSRVGSGGSSGKHDWRPTGVSIHVNLGANL
ncbi:Aldedh-domain-containing protein [Aspergillus phoenicis ATCC 13157]|uniref:Aldedh-domain-containing protein n=1 Tax=Aspergillus phoenicis ATCC 13157 TaxID=1353007 RepID=A0A370PIH8_ASPPH|nr:Aldedh-domain-containing protein [Aspergillus phoenicis ATCC 13157]